MFYRFHRRLTIYFGIVNDFGKQNRFTNKPARGKLSISKSNQRQSLKRIAGKNRWIL